MFQQFKSLLTTQTGKDSTTVFVGTLINIIAGGLFFVFAPRILGVENYGLFATVMATGLMVTNFANFGIDTGILRFIKVGETQNNNRILKLAAKAYLSISILIVAIGLLFSQQIAIFLNAPQIGNLLTIAFIGTVFSLFANFFTSALQADKKFKEAMVVTTAANIARIIVLAVASYFTTLDLYFLTILFFFSTAISVMMGPILVPLNFLKEKEEHINLKNFFGYNFWIAASLAISSIPIDNYLLLKLADSAAVGLFTAPLKILSTTYQFAGGFSRVLAPRFSSFDTDQKAKQFAVKALVPVLGVAFAILLLSFFAPLIRFVWGEEYAWSVGVFRILTAGMAFFFADTIPMAIILYYFGKSKIAFAVTVLHYFVYSLLLYLLIPQYFEIGAAIAFSVSEIITFLTLTAYVLFKFAKTHVS